MNIWPFNCKAKLDQMDSEFERQQSQFRIDCARALIEAHFTGDAKAERLQKVVAAQAAHDRKYGK